MDTVCITFTVQQSESKPAATAKKAPVAKKIPGLCTASVGGNANKKRKCGRTKGRRKFCDRCHAWNRAGDQRCSVTGETIRSAGVCGRHGGPSQRGASPSNAGVQELEKGQKKLEKGQKKIEKEQQKVVKEIAGIKEILTNSPKVPASAAKRPASPPPAKFPAKRKKATAQQALSGVGTAEEPIALDMQQRGTCRIDLT